jgi:hypothetical protein
MHPFGSGVSRPRPSRHRPIQFSTGLPSFLAKKIFLFRPIYLLVSLVYLNVSLIEFMTARQTTLICADCASKCLPKIFGLESPLPFGSHKSAYEKGCD